MGSVTILPKLYCNKQSMQLRAPINSETLQKKFPDVYREFFLQNEIVLSTSLDIPILHDNNTRFRGIGIEQKIPLRIYCGIRKGNISASRVHQYDFVKNTFSTCSIKERYPAFIEALETITKEMKLPEEQSFTIDLLSETHEGHGMGGTSKFGILLIVLFMIQYKTIPIAPTSLHTALKEEKTRKRLLDMLLQFMYVINKKDTDVSGLCSLLSSSAPDYIACLQPLHSTKDFEQIRKSNQFQIGSINDVFHISEDSSPYDLYHIYIGKKSPLTEYKKSHTYDKEQLDEAIEIVQSKLKNKELSASNSHYFDITNVMYDLSLQFFLAFGSMLEHPLSTENLEKAIKVLRQYAAIKRFIEPEEGEFGEVIDTFTMILNSRNCRNFCIIRNGSFKSGGAIQMIAEREKHREIIEEAFQELQKTYPYLFMSHVSYIDGKAGPGLHIEKWQSEQLLSPYDGKDQFVLVDWDGNKQFISHADIYTQDYDLVIDFIQNKIIINKEPLTSKELHSQRMSIDILRILLDRLNEDVANTSLPVSSYSQSKNEVQGKIIIPLTKLVKEKTGKDLLLTCKGTNTSFFLKLSKGDIRLGQAYNLGKK